MSKWFQVVGWTALLLVTYGCQVKMREAEQEGIPVAAQPPRASDFSAPLLSGDGGHVTLAELKGKVALLDFWATWCAPCRYELPAINSLYAELKDKNFVVIGLTVDQGTQDEVAAAVRQFDMTYPVALAGENVQSVFGGIRAVPTKFLLDKSGAIRKQYVGIVPMSQMRADISALLTE